MANYDARIILAGQSPDILGSMARGNELAAQTNQLQTQNALSSLFQQQGPAIMSGDQNALSALSRISPDAALGVQDKRLGMDATRQGMRINDERLSLARDQARQSAMQFAAQMSAAERAEAAAETERALAMATQINDAATWDATMRRLGQDQFVGQFDNKDMLIAGAVGVAEALKMGQGPAPQTNLAKLKADFDAGLIDRATYEAAVRKATAANGMRLTTGPDGAITFEQGEGVTGGVVNNKPGTMSQDYALVPDGTSPTGMRAVPQPGSPAAQEAQAAEASAAAAQDQKKQQASIVTGTINDIRRILTKTNPDGSKVKQSLIGRMLDVPEVGIVGSMIQPFNQEATDVKNKLAVLESAVAFDRLQAMRDASPTGGALGAISERELTLLASALGSLQTTTSEPELLKTLEVIEGIMAKAAAYPNAAEFGFAEGGGEMTDDDLLRMYGGE